MINRASQLRRALRSTVEGLRLSETRKLRAIECDAIRAGVVHKTDTAMAAQEEVTAMAIGQLTPINTVK